MSQTQRQPVPFVRDNSRTVETYRDEPASTRVINLGDQVKELQNLSTIPMGTSLRRLLFVWFRVYVLETKRGKQERVNVRIPLPIPIIGVMFARQLSFQKAAQIAAQARRGEDVSDLLDSTMGFELIRVEDDHAERNKSTLVVIGLD